MKTKGNVKVSIKNEHKVTVKGKSFRIDVHVTYYYYQGPEHVIYEVQKNRKESDFLQKISHLNKSETLQVIYEDEVPDECNAMNEYVYKKIIIP